MGLQYISKHQDFSPDVIIFSNNDVVFDQKGWLEALCAHFTETVGAVGPTSNYVSGRQQTSFNHPHITEEETNTLIGFFLAVRRDALEDVGFHLCSLEGFLDENEKKDTHIGLGGADDHDLSIRLRRAGYRLIIARDVLIYHSGSKSFFEVLGTEGYNRQWQLADLALARKWGKSEVDRLFAPPLNIALGVALRDWHCHWKFASSLMMMVKPWNFNLIDAPRSVIDQARNAIVDQARKCGAHFLLFLDDDHIILPDTFTRLFSHHKSVVGALAFRRLPPYGPCIFSWRTYPENGDLGVIDHPDWIRTGLRQVDAIGFGAVLIDMQVFEKLGPPPWFKFSEVGEDLHFCDLCAQKGIEIWCDTDLVLPHIDTSGVEITDATFIEYHKKQQQAVKEVA